MSALRIDGKVVTEDEFFAEIKRRGELGMVNDEVRMYMLDADPDHLRRAIAMAKACDIEPHPSWSAELRRARKPNARPAKAYRLMRLARLDAWAAKNCPGWNEQELQAWLARELDMDIETLRVVLLRARRHPKWILVRPARKKKPPKHLSILL